MIEGVGRWVGGGLIQPPRHLVIELFRNIYLNVVSKLSEAQDIAVHLTPLLYPLKVILRHHFIIGGTWNTACFYQELRTAEYSDLKEKFPVLFHLLCLLYSNCVSYSKPIRIITLLQVPFKLWTEIILSIPFALGDQ